MANAIKANGGMTYQNIRGSQLYVHSGAMVDFVNIHLNFSFMEKRKSLVTQLN